MSKSKLCASCGASLPEGSEKCPKCGHEEPKTKFVSKPTVASAEFIAEQIWNRKAAPEYLISNQEIEIYITKETGVVINYVGLNRLQKVTVFASDQCFDDLLFSPTERKIPCEIGSLKLKPLAKAKDNEPTTTLSFLGDMRGIVLFRVRGGGHFFAYDKELMSDDFGRHSFFNVYVQREYSDGNLVSRYVRYAELYPSKMELFTPLKAYINAKKDVVDFLAIVTHPDTSPQPQKYLRIGDAITQLKKNSVIVLGKDNPLLRRIRDELRTLHYESFLVKEQPDLPEQSPEEKAKLYALISKFAVMEDSEASGHIAEFEYCKNNRVVLALLRKKGRGSTWMIGDAQLVDVNYIKTFEYDERNVHNVLIEASKWAESFIQRRGAVYKDYFSN